MYFAGPGPAGAGARGREGDGAPAGVRANVVYAPRHATGRATARKFRPDNDLLGAARGQARGSPNPGRPPASVSLRGRSAPHPRKKSPPCPLASPPLCRPFGARVNLAWRVIVYYILRNRAVSGLTRAAAAAAAAAVRMRPHRADGSAPEWPRGRKQMNLYFWRLDRHTHTAATTTTTEEKLHGRRRGRRERPHFTVCRPSLL